MKLKMIANKNKDILDVHFTKIQYRPKINPNNQILEAIDYDTLTNKKIFDNKIYVDIYGKYHVGHIINKYKGLYTIKLDMIKSYTRF